MAKFVENIDWFNTGHWPNIALQKYLYGGEEAYA
jgi:hypothetical protein